MAKKAVATLRSLDKTYSKIIRMKRSEKTGAYYFEETTISRRPSFPPTRCRSSLLRDNLRKPQNNRAFP